MTRLYLTADHYLLIPECWLFWTYQGETYRRNGSRIEMQIGKRWVGVMSMQEVA